MALEPGPPILSSLGWDHFPLMDHLMECFSSKVARSDMGKRATPPAPQATVSVNENLVTRTTSLHPSGLLLDDKQDIASLGVLWSPEAGTICPSQICQVCVSAWWSPLQLLVVFVTETWGGVDGGMGTGLVE